MASEVPVRILATLFVQELRARCGRKNFCYRSSHGLATQESFLLLNVWHRKAKICRYANTPPLLLIGAILAGAIALLPPWFTGHSDQPVSEKLTVHDPVVCSELHARAEASGPVPRFLDFLDGAAWSDAIEKYPKPACTRHSVQFEQMQKWAQPACRLPMKQVIEVVDAFTQ
jgi:hypothetical protein